MAGAATVRVILELITNIHFSFFSVFTALHGMQTQSSDAHSVCPSVKVTALERNRRLSIYFRPYRLSRNT